MLRLSKKTEYALMAVRYMAENQNGKCITVKEISDKYGISFQLLSKLMQKLVRNRIMESIQGTKGGYRLSRTPDQIFLSDIIHSIEENYKLTDCIDAEIPAEGCARADCCVIRNPLTKIQKKIDDIFSETTVKQIL